MTDSAYLWCFAARRSAQAMPKGAGPGHTVPVKHYNAVMSADRPTEPLIIILKAYQAGMQ
jgi:hypothetical protein